MNVPSRRARIVKTHTRGRQSGWLGALHHKMSIIKKNITKSAISSDQLLVTITLCFSLELQLYQVLLLSVNSSPGLIPTLGRILSLNLSETILRYTFSNKSSKSVHITKTQVKENKAIDNRLLFGKRLKNKIKLKFKNLT